jgi:hypothetical protein
MMIGANAGQTLYVTLHVMEAGSFVSSPIPVAGASATRAADVLTVPVSGIDYPLTLFAEFERAVDAEISAGWVPQGGLAVTYNAQLCRYTYLQAMIRYDDELGGF